MCVNESSGGAGQIYSGEATRGISRWGRSWKGDLRKRSDPAGGAGRVRLSSSSGGLAVKS
jgi:hypothetical protein